jgi:fermentation-respiration switch protein FrsA (DUF1100 family)
LTTLFGVVVCGYIAICAAMYIFQDRLVWIPGPPPVSDPSAVGLAFENVTVETSDGERLHGWFVPGGPNVVLVSHGNAGSIEDRLNLMAHLHGMGHGVMVYDYRGFGRSTGSPSETGTYLDAEAAFDWLIAHGISPENIVLYGESLGGAVSIELATRRMPGHLIVENTFTTLPDVAARIYWWLPVKLLARARYDSLSKMPSLALPVMVIHSPGDELIPFAHGQALYQAAPDPKVFLETTGAHNAGGFRDSASGRAAVNAFLDSP